MRPELRLEEVMDLDLYLELKHIPSRILFKIVSESFNIKQSNLKYINTQFDNANDYVIKRNCSTDAAKAYLFEIYAKVFLGNIMDLSSLDSKVGTSEKYTGQIPYDVEDPFGIYLGSDNLDDALVKVNKESYRPLRTSKIKSPKKEQSELAISIHEDYQALEGLIDDAIDVEYDSMKHFRAHFNFMSKYFYSFMTNTKIPTTQKYKQMYNYLSNDERVIRFKIPDCLIEPVVAIIEQH